jgi:hypothetical protein
MSVCFPESAHFGLLEIAGRFEPVLDAAGAPHALHLFQDTDNAPASAVVTTILKAGAQFGRAFSLRKG